MTPRYKHHCLRCQFLGHWQDVDLYYCCRHVGYSSPALPAVEGEVVVMRDENDSGYGVQSVGYRSGFLISMRWRRWADSAFPDAYRKAIALAANKGLADKCFADMALSGIPLS